jgi:hypothetical protein
MQDNSSPDEDFASGDEVSFQSPPAKRKHSEDRPKKEELKWYPALDRVLLVECLDKEVWTATRSSKTAMFQSVADNLKAFNPARFRLATERNCSRRYKVLLENYVSDNWAKMNTSGTTEEYEEREVLLQQIKESAERWKDELKMSTEEKKRMEQELTDHGKLIREAAIANLVKQKQEKTPSPTESDPLVIMAIAIKDMVEASKPPPPPQLQSVTNVITLAEAGINTTWEYMTFAGIPANWHQGYVQSLTEYGFDTPKSVWLANGQQLIQAGIKLGHVNLLLHAKASLML